MPAALKHDVDRTARIFHALADPIRIKIVEFLCDGEQCVCDLTDALDTGQSRLSFHLKTLKDAGVVQDRRDGRWNYYSLRENIFEEVHDMLESLRTKPRGLSKASRHCN